MLYRLGDIELEVHEVTGLSQDHGWRYARFEGYGTRARLQSTGAELSKMSLEVRLHASLGDPDTRLKTLKAAGDAQQALPLGRGDGAALGDYVIESLSVTQRKCFADGLPFLITARLGLTEWAGDGATSPAQAQPGTALSQVPQPAPLPVFDGTVDPAGVARR